MAQYRVDIVDGKTVLCDWGGNEIYEIQLDSTINKISNFPDTMNFTGRPNPKIRNGNAWVSNGKTIWTRSADPFMDTKRLEWEVIELPENIDSFQDFEIISDKEAIILGAYWKYDEVLKKPARYDLDFTFNYYTGVIKKTLNAFDPDEHMGDNKNALFERARFRNGFMCRNGSKILLIGQFSGLVTIFDTDNDLFKKITVVPPEDMLSDPEAAVNNGRAIAWAAPLQGNEVLFVCRMWAAKTDDPGEYVSVNVFRKLDLDSGKVTFLGSDFRGLEADSAVSLLEKDGELVSARGLIDSINAPIQQSKY